MLVLNSTGMLQNSFDLVLSGCLASKDRELIPPALFPHILLLLGYWLFIFSLAFQVFYVRLRLETEAAWGAAGSPCHASWKDVKIPSPEFAFISFSSAFLVSFAKKEILRKMENVTLISYIDKSVSDKTSYKIERKKRGKASFSRTRLQIQSNASLTMMNYNANLSNYFLPPLSVMYCPLK
jgi:hypothetical protein